MDVIRGCSFYDVCYSTISVGHSFFTPLGSKAGDPALRWDKVGAIKRYDVAWSNSPTDSRNTFTLMHIASYYSYPTLSFTWDDVEYFQRPVL